MIDKDLLQILACPETHQPLTEATQEQLDAVNAKISAGEVSTKAGNKVEAELTGGLVREDGKVIYPVKDGIPVLLIDEGIAL